MNILASFVSFFIFTGISYGQISSFVELGPTKVLSQARADAIAGRHAQALEKYAWFYANALKYDESLSSARLTILTEWSKLSEIYPPSLIAMKKVRDQVGIEIQKIDPKTVQKAFEEFEVLNRNLKEPNLTCDLFLSIEKKNKEIAKILYRDAEDSLVQGKKFSVCNNYVSADQLSIHVQEFQVIKEMTGKSQLPDLVRAELYKPFKQKVSTLVYLLIINKRQTEADEVIARALKELNTLEFRSELEKTVKVARQAAVNR